MLSDDEVKSFLSSQNLKLTKKNSNPIGILKYGVIGELIDKKENSCNARFQDLKGWINKNDAWGC